MTSLLITPDIANKRAKITGKIACGENVAVTITGMGSVPRGELHLRVLYSGKTIAQFPRPNSTDEWSGDDDLECVLHLNTCQAYAAVRGCEADCVFVLEEMGDDENDIQPTLYFTKWHTILGWPRRPERLELYDLGVFPHVIADITQLKEWRLLDRARIDGAWEGIANAMRLISANAVEIAKKANASNVYTKAQTFTKDEVRNMVAFMAKPLAGIEFRLANAGDVWDVVDFITKTLGGRVEGEVNPEAENPTISGFVPDADGQPHAISAVFDGENWTTVVDPE